MSSNRLTNQTLLIDADDTLWENVSSSLPEIRVITGLFGPEV